MLRRVIAQKRQLATMRIMYNNSKGVGETVEKETKETMETAEIKEIKEKHEQLDKKHALLQQAYQNTKIEMRQVQERHLKEIEKTKEYGAQLFAKDLFTVYDTLSNAIRYSTEKTSKQENEGFDMIRKQIIKVFKTHGLHLIDPKEGDPFNHEIHEALYQMKHDEYKDGEIGKVEQVGFQLKERVLRAAQVGVVKKE